VFTKREIDSFQGACRHHVRVQNHVHRRIAELIGVTGASAWKPPICAGVLQRHDRRDVYIQCFGTTDNASGWDSLKYSYSTRLVGTRSRSCFINKAIFDKLDPSMQHGGAGRRRKEAEQRGVEHGGWRDAAKEKQCAEHGMLIAIPPAKLMADSAKSANDDDLNG
jgi:hypothetical protein